MRMRQRAGAQSLRSACHAARSRSAAYASPRAAILCRYARERLRFEPPSQHTATADARSHACAHRGTGLRARRAAPRSADFAPRTQRFIHAMILPCGARERRKRARTRLESDACVRDVGSRAPRGTPRICAVLFAHEKAQCARGNAARMAYKGALFSATRRRFTRVEAAAQRRAVYAQSRVPLICRAQQQ